MTRYEYKTLDAYTQAEFAVRKGVVEDDRTTPISRVGRLLNKYGDEGWELKSTLEITSGHYKFFLMREKVLVPLTPEMEV